MQGIEKARKTEELAGQTSKGKGAGKKTKPPEKNPEPEQQVEQESEEPGDLVIDEEEEY